MSKYLFLIAAVLAVHGWTAVQHILPWPAFHNEWPFVAMLLILAIPAVWAVGSKENSARGLPFAGVVPIFLSLIPCFQFMAGQVVFLGDAVMAALYLWLLGIAIVVGFRLGASRGNTFVDSSAVVIVIGALISCLLSSHQWLRLDAFGIWLVEMPPTGRPQGNLAQPNNLATLLSCGLAATLFLRERGQIRAATLWCAALIFMAGIAMTRSRTALLTATVTLTWLLLFRGRLRMRCSLREVLCGFALLVAVWVGWPEVSGWLQLDAESTASRLSGALSGNVRFVIWRELLDAAFRRPLVGYGWNQVSFAQIAVAAEHQQSVFVEHSHNIALDLLIWNGMLLGGLIVLSVGWWLYSRARCLSSVESWFALLIVLAVGTHAMLELPLEYAYFLVPVGICAGIVEWRHVGAPTVCVPHGIVKASLAVVFLISMVVFVEYRKVEENFRQMRFEAVKIERRVGSYGAPPVQLLTQLREYIRFSRTDAREGMSEQELAWMRSVAHRFPFARSLTRYVLALALNRRYEEARLELARFQNLHDPVSFNQAIGSLEALLPRYPHLLNVMSDYELLLHGERRLSAELPEP